MKNRILAIFTSLVLLLTLLPIPSFATVEEVNEAEGTKKEGETELVELPANDEGDVNLRLIEGDSIAIYNVQIGWGSMKFEFDTGGRTWDPVNHRYIEGSGEPCWTVETYLDGEEEDGLALESNTGNNVITIFNNSNRAMMAEFAYHDDDTIINEGVVMGNFFGTGNQAREAALTLDPAELDNIQNTLNVTTVAEDGTETLHEDALILHSASGYYTQDDDWIAWEDDTDYALEWGFADQAFFAFSGTPTEDMGYTTYFGKVGTITVTITELENLYCFEKWFQDPEEETDIT